MLMKNVKIFIYDKQWKTFCCCQRNKSYNMLNITSTIRNIINKGRSYLFKFHSAYVQCEAQCNEKVASECVLNQTNRRSILFNSTKLNQIVHSEISRNLSEITLQNSARFSSSSVASQGHLVRLLRPIASRFLNGFFGKLSTTVNGSRNHSVQKLFGGSAPFFALVGIILNSGTENGLLTADDEVETLCGNVREAISRAGWIHNAEFWQKPKSENEKSFSTFSLADYKIGPVIDKGCNAIVFAANYAEVAGEKEIASCSLGQHKNKCTTELSSESVLALQQLPSLPLHGNNEKCSIKDFIIGSQPVFIDSIIHKSCTFPEDITNLMPHQLTEDGNKQETFSEEKGNLKKSAISMGAANVEEYPLAIKMLFNYEAESNAPAILNAMYKELTPVRSLHLDGIHMAWKEKFESIGRQLPAHPNIVDMPCMFVDRVPLLHSSLALCPQALPVRLSAQGMGRNMSLFCVMKRYDCTLNQYLKQFNPPIRTSVLIWTQILEAVLHINSQSIAHRDLKSDNILLSLHEGIGLPRVVITDFGCCIACKHNMAVPFPHWEADSRMGNAALMAPEVKTARPGLLQVINYSRCDVWAAGALAYEIFGMHNPFVTTKPDTVPLDSATYKESCLPQLSKEVPSAVRRLVVAMLCKNPAKGPSARLCATVCQLQLWAPSKWLNRSAIMMPSHNEVMRWLLCVCSKVLCEAGMPSKNTSRKESSAVLEYNILSTFLSRVRYEDITQAIRWIRSF